jgi:PhzF family phenazine biosynthesis protein
MTTYRFKQVDVFTDRPFLGNPVAVVLGADGIDDGTMQRIANWTNLSETTFVLKPTSGEADYRLRIFRPVEELSFAGHPTIGSAHAVLEAGLAPAGAGSLRQECPAGIIPLTVEQTDAGRRIFARAPRPKIVHSYETSVDAISAALGVPVSADPAPASIDVGPVWLIARVEDVESVRSMKPSMDAVARLSVDFNVTGITVFSLLEDGDEAVYVRSFGPATGAPEDPVCGSGNASVGGYLAHTGLVSQTGSSYVARQGAELGRDGRVYVRLLEDGNVEIGGHAVTVVDGEIEV